MRKGNQGQQLKSKIRTYRLETRGQNLNVRFCPGSKYYSSSSVYSGGVISSLKS